MSSPTEKANLLIAKAISTASEFPEEARTCALSAVHLIVKYGISIGGSPNNGRYAEGRIAQLESDLKQSDELLQESYTTNDRLITVNDRLSEQISALRAELAASKTKKRPAKNVSNKYKSVHFDVSDTDCEDGRYLESQFPSRCASCKRGIAIGDTVWWRGPGRGVLCGDCR